MWQEMSHSQHYAQEPLIPSLPRSSWLQAPHRRNHPRMERWLTVWYGTHGQRTLPFIILPALPRPLPDSSLIWQLYSPRLSSAERALRMRPPSSIGLPGLGSQQFPSADSIGNLRWVIGGRGDCACARPALRASAVPLFPAGRSAGGGASGSLGGCFCTRGSADLPFQTRRWGRGSMHVDTHGLLSHVHF